MLVNQWGWIRKFDDAGVIVVLSMKNILLYSATICATDSVAALTMIINLLTDVLYQWVDPRVKLK